MYWVFCPLPSIYLLLFQVHAPGAFPPQNFLSTFFHCLLPNSLHLSFTAWPLITCIFSNCLIVSMPLQIDYEIVLLVWKGWKNDNKVQEILTTDSYSPWELQWGFTFQPHCSYNVILGRGGEPSQILWER